MKGDGCITNRGRNVWRVRVFAGVDPVTGKQKFVCATVHGTKADAKNKRDEINREIENGLNVDAKGETIIGFAEQWADVRRMTGATTERGIQDDLRGIKHIASKLGDVPIRKLDARIIERGYTELLADGLSGTTVNHAHLAFKAMLEKAVDYGIITVNPCRKVSAPKRNKPERNALDVREAAELRRKLDESEVAELEKLASKERRQQLKGNWYGRGFIRGIAPVSCIMGVRMALSTGLRRGELLAVTWGAIDLEGGTLSVLRSLTSEGELKEPKTRAGARTLSLDGNTLAHLSVWKERQAAELRKFGAKQTDATPVCCSNVGGYLNPSNFTHWWGEWRKQAGFPDLKLHELRHTQATLLLAHGVDVKTVQTRMGHANASITLDWYAHAVPGKDAEAAALIGNLTTPREPVIVETARSA